MSESVTLARPYAKAVFELAREQGAVEAWSGLLNNLAQLASNDEARRLLFHPALSAEQKSAFLLESLNQLSSGAGSDARKEQVANFLKTLSEHDRLPLLPEISEVFEFQRSRLESTVEVMVETAFPMDEESQIKLAESLQTRLQRKVSLQTEVNEALIGGIIVRAGDTVIDGSVKGRLARLAESVHI